MRIWLLLLTVIAIVTLAGPASAQTVPTIPPLGRSDTECISANPRPDCFGSTEFDRSNRGNLLLFAVLGVALAGIGTVIVRSTLRTGRARAATAKAADDGDRL